MLKRFSVNPLVAIVRSNLAHQPVPPPQIIPASTLPKSIATEHTVYEEER
jgi:hypothetical protein